MSRFDTYKDEEQTTNHTRARVGMGIGFLVLALGLVWLSFKVSRQVAHVKSHFWSYLGRGLLGVCILTVCILLIFVVLNSIGKKKSYDEHYTHDDAEKDA